MTILITLCARAGSKGLPDKNIKLLHGLPLLVHTINHAKQWSKGATIILSTDSPAYAEVARSHGIDVPFLRPAELASDASGKVPVLVHALKESERILACQFETLLDLDVSAPLRTVADIDNGYKLFCSTGVDVCFSVTASRRSPYFNMVERNDSGKVVLCKQPAQQVLSRQASPQTWDLNASIYFYRRDFLLKEPKNLWEGSIEIFEMSEETVFDINNELDFSLVETILSTYNIGKS